MAVSYDFTSWLDLKLQELNIDESVFGSYILGILESDESLEEKHEAIEGILTEILCDNIEDVLQNIMKKWSECNDKIEEVSLQESNLKVEEQLVKLLDSTKIKSIVKERQYTEEEKRIREQILSQYSQAEVSGAESDAQSDGDGDKHSSGNNNSRGIERNTNFSDVVTLQKEKREQARLESAAKKQKDKEDREKQKQMREEKKEKRKTVKGERRR